jgi:arginine-tRNA-protein transferase
MCWEMHMRVRLQSYIPSQKRAVTYCQQWHDLGLQLTFSSEKAQKRNDFDLVSSLHEAESDHVKQPPEPQHDFKVNLEPDSFTQEKYDLYANYQAHVHHDPPNEINVSGFKRFLCSSPLTPVSPADSGRKYGYGAFHQCYRLDGRLIAIGVIDLLPHCVSGVYFIYHSDFEKWSFGKLSALRELGLALEYDYKYYYMGYYIHSCAKMKYKNDYRPQYFLDVENWDWDPMDGAALALLDRNHYVSMSKFRETTATTTENNEDVVSETQKTRPDVTTQKITEEIGKGTPLFHLDFPGMMTPEQLEEEIDLDNIILNLDAGLYPCNVGRVFFNFRKCLTVIVSRLW